MENKKQKSKRTKKKKNPSYYKKIWESFDLLVKAFKILLLTFNWSYL